MSWHVRYFNTSLRVELQSLELMSEQDALAAAWELAQDGAHITAIEGPDGEIVGPDEIDVWFKERGNNASNGPQRG